VATNPPFTAFNWPRPRLVISYLFWCLGLVGLCGLHRFYNGKRISGCLWLFTFGWLGIGQLIDLFNIPELVLQAERQQGSLERQLLLLARSSGSAGFTLNDALLAVPDPALGSKRLRTEIDRMLRAELLDVANDPAGRVIYREP
jgi:TM2 domain-containing membrane protein YozV